MDDIIKPVAEWISQNIPLSIGIGIFIFCLFFEVSKIKVYPLRWLWKAISWPFKKIDEQRTESFKGIVNSMKTDLEKNLTEMQKGTMQNCVVAQENFAKLEGRFNELDGRFNELDNRFDDLGKKQSETDERLDQLAAARIKNHVLNFARQCRKGELHSREDFANLIREHTLYTQLVEKYHWDNEVYQHDYEYILRVYDKCNDEGTVLE